VSNARRKPAVFILEPQMLFVSDLTQTIARCGGTVVRVVDRLENLDLGSLRADVAILDLDYAPELGSALRRILNGAIFYDPRADAA